MNKEKIKNYVLVHEKRFYDYTFKIYLAFGDSIGSIKVQLFCSTIKKFSEKLSEEIVYIDLSDIEKVKSLIQVKIDLFKKQINNYIESLKIILDIFDKYENKETNK